MVGLYKRFKFQLNRMKNRRVIRGQSFRHSLPTLDCKFEPNVTFTDRDETDLSSGTSFIPIGEGHIRLKLAVQSW